METEAVPAETPSDSMLQTWWFSFVVRAGLVLLAFWALWFAQDRYGTFRVRLIRPFLGFDSSLWLLAVVATVVAGLLFGLAGWLPFTRIRYLPSRLLLAFVALVPTAHFWWIFFNYHGDSSRWLGRAYWFDMSAETQFVLAGFAGVALASGFRANDRALGPLEP